MRVRCACQRVPWSQREIAVLKEAVHKYVSKSGGAAWAAILCAHARDFRPSRNAVDLKVGCRLCVALRAGELQGLRC